MSCEKTFKGDKYEFFKKNYKGKKGGNGCVYDVEITNAEVKYPVVAKFFEYDKHEKDKRYERFKKETKMIQELHGQLEGILEIMDMNCPKQTPNNKEGAWYLMPKAKEYRIKDSSDFIDKLGEMHELAKIISELHKLKIAHRDIKPENILIYKGNIVLSDFGLVWTINQDRITDENERIGPYKILPPELENIDLDSTLDFCPSDVYLFAKVLWMTLKENNAGFRGKYNRSEQQIYIDRERYNIPTLEPIHCLIEKATCDTMTERITIDECIYYIKQQEKIITGDMSEEEINKLCFEEVSRELIGQNEPDGNIYYDHKKIYNILSSIIELSRIYVRSVNEPMENKKQIQVTSLDILNDGMGRFNYYFKRKKVKEYLFKIKTLTYFHSNSTNNHPTNIVLNLTNIDNYDDEYRSFGAASLYFENDDKKIIIKEDYKIILEC